MELTHEEAVKRARKGAAWLDEKLGPGWRKHVVRKRLRMNAGVIFIKGDCGCILAQLDASPIGTNGDGDCLGVWSHMARRLGIRTLSGRTAMSCGFYADRQAEYPILTKAWLEVLHEVTP